MPGWLDKAKEAANKAAEEAKKLAEAAKSADYGAMIDKTKNMAAHAAEEAKKAAGNVMKKDGSMPETQPDIIPEQDNPQGHATTGQTPVQTQTTTQAPATAQPSAPQIDVATVRAKIAQVEQLLHEIKSLLK